MSPRTPGRISRGRERRHHARWPVAERRHHLLAGRRSLCLRDPAGTSRHAQNAWSARFLAWSSDPVPSYTCNTATVKDQMLATLCYGQISVSTPGPSVIVPPARSAPGCAPRFALDAANESISASTWHEGPTAPRVRSCRRCWQLATAGMIKTVEASAHPAEGQF